MRGEGLVLLAPRFAALSRARRHEALGLLAALLLDAARQRDGGMTVAFDSGIDGGWRGVEQSERVGGRPHGGAKRRAQADATKDGE